MWAKKLDNSPKQTWAGRHDTRQKVKQSWSSKQELFGLVQIKKARSEYTLNFIGDNWDKARDWDLNHQTFTHWPTFPRQARFTFLVQWQQKVKGQRHECKLTLQVIMSLTLCCMDWPALGLTSR